MGYSPWGRKELDTNERLTLSLLYFHDTLHDNTEFQGMRWKRNDLSRQALKVT